MLVKRANAAFNQGNYEEALDLYRKASKILGVGNFEYNIRVCRRNLPVEKKIKNKNEIKGLSKSEIYAVETLSKFLGQRRLPENIGVEELPIASVVMTSFNSRKTIKESIETLMNQSYPNVEIVVCDDRSDDGTWEILCEMETRHPKVLSCIRMGTNGGTYVAKNVAITRSRGDVIFFQDSDDYSHPDRVLVQMIPMLNDINIIATRSKYHRFSPQSGDPVLLGGKVERYGFITLAVRRSVFERIGFFDAVRKAGDDEWFQRLLHFYGEESVKHINCSLYMAELRENSLISDMLHMNADGSMNQTSSSERRQYVSQFQSRFLDKEKNEEWFKREFPPVPLRVSESYPAGMAAIDGALCPVIGVVCSIPSRMHLLREVVSSVAFQVDVLYVYLDAYGKVPEFLEKYENVVVRRTENFGEKLRDNAKFLPFSELKEGLEEFYYLTLDDDLIYPPDYSRGLISRINFFEKSVVCGLHGVMCEEYPKKYFARRYVHHFSKCGLLASRPVNNLGTGTAGFHSSAFDALDPYAWNPGGMVDIHFSIAAKMSGVPMICIERHAGWLKEHEQEESSPSLYKEFMEKDGEIVEVLNKAAPWGNVAINEVLSQCTPSLQNLIRPLLPKFSTSYNISDIFERYRY